MTLPEPRELAIESRAGIGGLQYDLRARCGPAWLGHGHAKFYGFAGADGDYRRTRG
jgi:hypothetical protein